MPCKLFSKAGVTQWRASNGVCVCVWYEVVPPTGCVFLPQLYAGSLNVRAPTGRGFL